MKRKDSMAINEMDVKRSEAKSPTKSMVTAAMVYAILGLSAGVYYREFTKLMDFDGRTRLSLAHGHYIALGMFVFLFFALLERSFGWTISSRADGKSSASKWLLAYHIGLNIAAFGFLWRGTLEVMGTELSSGMNASIAGVSGIGHMLLAVSLVTILAKVRARA